MTLLLGLDIGTTATKGLLLDSQRGVVASAERPMQLHSPHPGWAEEDPASWWTNACEIARELSSYGLPVAVGVSGMVPCVVLTDDDGAPLRASIQQNDARAVDEIDAMRAALSEARVLERTGSAITQQSVGPKLMWLMRNEPDRWERTAAVQGSYDFIVARLTESVGVEANWALESGLFDLETGSWARDVLSVAGIAPPLLPVVRQPSEIAGRLSHQSSLDTGLAEGTPVVAGSADHVAAAFAAGLVDEGQTLIKLGGAGDILMVSEAPLMDERLFLDFHLIPGRYLPNGCMATSGSLVRWFQRVIGQDAPLDQLDAEARSVPAGSDGIVSLPYFLGEKTPINDPHARGAFVGLHLGHHRGHLFRSVLEGIAYGFRHHIDVFTELGHVPTSVRVSDGGARSDLWVQIIADVLSRPVEVLAGRGGAAMSAAYLAGMATGVFSDWHDIERFITLSRVVRPHAISDYEDGYRVFRSLYPALKPSFPR
jgi:xylulokinase